MPRTSPPSPHTEVKRFKNGTKVMNASGTNGLSKNGKRMGRPSVYLTMANKLALNPLTIPELIETIVGLYGLTDEEIGDFFGVDPMSIWTWRKLYPDFSEAIKRGRDRFDALGVERNALLKRALGYDYVETTKEARPVKDVVKGKVVITGYEMVVTKEVVKHVPPDPTSCMFWLQNRHKDRWKPVQSLLKAGLGDGSGGDISIREGDKHLHLHKHGVKDEDVPDDNTAVQILRILDQCGQLGSGNQEVIDTEAEQVDQADANG